MKYVLCLLSLLCFTSTTTLAQTTPVGNWKMTVPTEDGSTMSVKVSIKSDGTYDVDFGMDGNVEVKGEYKMNGNQMTIKDVSSGENSCSGEGVYTFEVSGDSLKMTRVKDACPNRGGPEGVMVFSKA